MKTRYSFVLLPIFGLVGCGGGGGDEVPATVDRVEADIISNEVREYKLIEIQLDNGASVTKADLVNGRGHVDNSHFPKGFSGNHAARLHSVTVNGSDISENIVLRGYRGSYASIFISNPLEKSFPERPAKERSQGTYARSVIQTESYDLPYSGQFSYYGNAFNNDPANDARLHYTIDYGRRLGWGEISESKAQGRQMLTESSVGYRSNVLGNLDGVGVKDGIVKNPQGDSLGEYHLVIAGPSGEEILGVVEYDNDSKEMHFHGNRR